MKKLILFLSLLLSLNTRAATAPVLLGGNTNDQVLFVFFLSNGMTNADRIIAGLNTNGTLKFNTNLIAYGFLPVGQTNWIFTGATNSAWLASLGLTNGQYVAATNAAWLASLGLTNTPFTSATNAEFVFLNTKTNSFLTASTNAAWLAFVAASNSQFTAATQSAKAYTDANIGGGGGGGSLITNFDGIVITNSITLASNVVIAGTTMADGTGSSVSIATGKGVDVAGDGEVPGSAGDLNLTASNPGTNSNDGTLPAFHAGVNIMAAGGVSITGNMDNHDSSDGILSVADHQTGLQLIYFTGSDGILYPDMEFHNGIIYVPTIGIGGQFTDGGGADGILNIKDTNQDAFVYIDKNSLIVSNGVTSTFFGPVILSGGAVCTVQTSNAVMNTIITNNYGVPILVTPENAILTTASVVGYSQVSFLCPGTGTNRATVLSTIGGVTGTYTNGISPIVVPVNSTFFFTNTSSGSGDTSLIDRYQITQLVK